MEEKEDRKYDGTMHPSEWRRVIEKNRRNHAKLEAAPEVEEVSEEEAKITQQNLWDSHEAAQQKETKEV